MSDGDFARQNTCIEHIIVYAVKLLILGNVDAC